MKKKYGTEWKGEARTDGTQRYVVRKQQHDQKHRHAHQGGLEMHRQNHPEQGGHSFPAPESGEDGKQVPHYRDYPQRALVIHELGRRLRTGNGGPDEVGTRTKARRVGKAWVSTGVCRWSTYQ